MTLDEEKLFNIAAFLGKLEMPPYELAQYIATVLGHVLRDIPDERIFATNNTKRSIAVDEIMDLIYETVNENDEG